MTRELLMESKTKDALALDELLSLRQRLRLSALAMLRSLADGSAPPTGRYPGSRHLALAHHHADLWRELCDDYAKDSENDDLPTFADLKNAVCRQKTKARRERRLAELEATIAGLSPAVRERYGIDRSVREMTRQQQRTLWLFIVPDDGKGR